VVRLKYSANSQFSGIAGDRSQTQAKCRIDLEVVGDLEFFKWISSSRHPIRGRNGAFIKPDRAFP
jgi:hypothetical protein